MTRQTRCRLHPIRMPPSKGKSYAPPIDVRPACNLRFAEISALPAISVLPKSSPARFEKAACARGIRLKSIFFLFIRFRIRMQRFVHFVFASLDKFNLSILNKKTGKKHFNRFLPVFYETIRLLPLYKTICRTFLTDGRTCLQISPICTRILRQIERNTRTMLPKATFPNASARGNARLSDTLRVPPLQSEGKSHRCIIEGASSVHYSFVRLYAPDDHFAVRIVPEISRRRRGALRIIIPRRLR